MYVFGQNSNPNVILRSLMLKIESKFFFKKQNRAFLL